MAFWSLARRKFSRLAELSFSERWHLVQAIVLLPVTAVARRAASFKRVQALVAALVPLDPAANRTPEDTLVTARQYARVVQVAARHGLLRANCLEQSLTLWAMLRRAGIDSCIVFGARAQDGQFEAHAWVECLGTVLNDGADVDQRFVVMAVGRHMSGMGAA